MRRLRTLSTGAWIAIGLAAGFLLAPAAAAAVSLVGIAGTNGVQAQVSLARQLQTTETTPNNYQSNYAFDDSAGCVKVLTVPTNHGLILKSANADVYTNGTPGIGDYLALYPNSSCVGNPIASDNPSALGAFTFSFGPGFGLAPGNSLYMFAERGVSWETEVSSYLTPAADVPANTTTPTTHSSFHGSGR